MSGEIANRLGRPRPSIRTPVHEGHAAAPAGFRFANVQQQHPDPGVGSAPLGTRTPPAAGTEMTNSWISPEAANARRLAIAGPALRRNGSKTKSCDNCRNPSVAALRLHAVPERLAVSPAKRRAEQLLRRLKRRPGQPPGLPGGAVVCRAKSVPQWTAPPYSVAGSSGAQVNFSLPRPRTWSYATRVVLQPSFLHPFFNRAALLFDRSRRVDYTGV